MKSNLTWKNTKSGKTNVTVLPGTEDEKKFALEGLHFSASAIADQLEDMDELIKVSSPVTHENADENGKGGVKHKRKGLDNGKDLAKMVRDAAGLKEKTEKPKRGKKPENRIAAALETVNGNGIAH